MYSRNDVSGFLLLTLPNCTVDSPSLPQQTGTLSLQCVTLGPSQTSTTNSTTDNAAGSPFTSNERDVWIVLKLNSFEAVIPSTQRINYSRADFTYMFLPDRKDTEFFRLVVPLDPHNPSSAQDLESMEVILSQYGVLHEVDTGKPQERTILGTNYDQPPPHTQLQSSGSFSFASPITSNDQMTSSPLGLTSASMSDFKGRLVLMDQDNGEIMGTLDETVKLREDDALSLPVKGGGKDPVVIELPSEEGPGTVGKNLPARVHLANEKDRDILVRTAGLISNGILFLSSALSSGITSLGDLYVAHSTPSTTPVIFSPRTSASVKRIHNISGVAVDVTSRTTNAIYQLIDVTIDKYTGRATFTGASPLQQARISPPPLPPRKGQIKEEKLDRGLSPPLPPRSRSPSDTRSVGDPVNSSASPRNTPLLNRVLASTDIILSALEKSATKLIESGTDAVSKGISHKYGAPAGDLSKLAGGTVRNVGLVYVDVQGVGRRALLKRAGKAVVKAKFAGHDIVFMSAGNVPIPRSR